MSDTFVKAGDAIRDVVISLDQRRKDKADALHQLGSSVRLMDGKMETGEIREWEVERGKQLFTRALEKIRDNSSPDYAIKFLEDTLVSIKG